ncbi:DUF6457 domain-containing protein [Nocardioides sp. R-C-SC26]|uniref:DUF6457 domain-containing protein n=1 Tax=Nocardioides sp. R-C-SC26 TaxID=2870414 RepID=UPI001E55E5BB|nr:DUF6457 domain-containing protein [Nocardioides sp. R-C-SC26]
MNLHDWIDELCDVLDLDTEVDEGLVRDLADLATDSVHPDAGPVTAFLLGYAAAKRDADPDDLEALSVRAQRLAESWDRPAAAPDPDDIDDDVPDDGSVARVDHTGDVADFEDLEAAR